MAVSALLEGVGALDFKNQNQTLNQTPNPKPQTLNPKQNPQPPKKGSLRPSKAL